MVDVRCGGCRRDALCPFQEYKEGKNDVVKWEREYYAHDRVDLHKFLVYVLKYTNSSLPVINYQYLLFIFTLLSLVLERSRQKLATP